VRVKVRARVSRVLVSGGGAYETHEA